MLELLQVARKRRCVDALDIRAGDILPNVKSDERVTYRPAWLVSRSGNARDITDARMYVLTVPKKCRATTLGYK